MPALAQVADIPGSGSFTPDQVAQAQMALDTASAAVRAFCRRQFTASQRTTRLRAKGNWILLPQKPVISVDRVAVLVYGTPTQTSGWVWDGLDRVWIGNLGIVINLAEELTEAIQFGVTVAEVTYTSGYALLPEDVVTVTANLAARALAIPAGGVYQSQTAGPFSQTVAPWAQGGPLALSDADKMILKQYRRGGNTIELRS